MKSASKNWFLLCLALVLFNCGSNKPQPEVRPAIPMEKAYVLLRSEGGENDLAELKNILNSDFVTNNISTNIVSYPLTRAWNNNQIFTTAYNDKYDYIVLIDQVAKFTIDNKTQVGGKYQIRSYHIKSPNPDWVDLGQKTCNITVKPSIKKFTQQIVSDIVPNYKSSTISFDDDEEYAENSHTSNSGYQTFKSSNEIDKEIEELKNQLKLEKEKTEKVLAEKERLKKQYEEALAKEKQKTELVLSSLKLAKKEKDRISQLKAEEELFRKKQRQKEIADAIAIKKEEIRKKEVEYALKNPKPVIVEAKKEPTREERIKEKQEAKKRLAEERALIRKKQEEEAFQLREEKKRLAEIKRKEQKRKQEELINQRNEQKRLADLETSKRIEAKKEADKLAELEEAKKINAEKEKEKLLNEERIAKQLKAEKAIAETKRLEKLKLEEEAKSRKLENERLLKEEQRLAELQKEKEIKKLEQKEKERIEREKAKQEQERLALLEIQKAKQEEEAKQKLALEKQKLSREEKRLAEAKKEEEEYELKRQLKEKRRLAQAERDSKAKKSSITPKPEKTKKKLSKSKTSKDGKINTLVILRAKKDDATNLKKLQDNIEFDFLFAKTKATTHIYNKEQELDKTTIGRNNRSKFDFIIIVDQLDYKGDGYSNYQISTFNYNTDSNWKDDTIKPFNISNRESIKQLSKTITESI